MDLSIRENVIQQVQSLGEKELNQVYEYVAFLKFRAHRLVRSSFEAKEIAALYAEFADEDRELAEEGLAEYSEQLVTEDAR